MLSLTPRDSGVAVSSVVSPEDSLSDGISLQNYRDDPTLSSRDDDDDTDRVHSQQPLHPRGNAHPSPTSTTIPSPRIQEHHPQQATTIPSSSSYSCLSSLSSYALGLVFIFIVAIIWSVASIVVQYLYQEQDFDNPFVLTYIGTSLFTILLLFPYHTPTSTSTSTTAPASEGQQQQQLGNYQQVAVSEGEEEDGGDESPTTQRLNDHHHQQLQWTDYDHRIAAAKIAPVWFLSNFAYNASLKYTSITSSTILVNTGSLFTFLFALLTHDEHFHVFKLVGVLCGITGCVLTGLQDATTTTTTPPSINNNYNNDDDDALWRHTNEGGGGLFRLLFQKSGEQKQLSDDRLLFLDHISDDNNNNSDDDDLVWGDILSLVSAVFYGVYAVMVRVLCPHDESLMSMKRFLGYVGLWNMLALSPVVIWQIGVDRNVQFSLFVFACLVGKGLFDNVLSDYLWARAVVLTSATVATVGLGLTIPLAFLSDVVLGRPNVLNVKSVLGAVAVLAGFVLVNLGQQEEEEEKEDGRIEGPNTALPLSPSQVPYHHHRSDMTEDLG